MEEELKDVVSELISSNFDVDIDIVKESFDIFLSELWDAGYDINEWYE